MGVAVVQLKGVVFLSTMKNIDTKNELVLKNLMSVIVSNLIPIQQTKGLEICGDQSLIDALIKAMNLDKIPTKVMVQNNYALYKAEKYDSFIVERIKESKLKIDNVSDKDKEELFGHLIEGDMASKEQTSLIKEWYPQYCTDVGLNMNEDSMNAIIRSMQSKKVYFWGRERTKMIKKKEENEEKKKETEYDLVSFAVITGYTKNCSKIGVVYTPKNERRKGYATHLVGCLSQIMEKEKKMVWIT